MHSAVPTRWRVLLLPVRRVLVSEGWLTVSGVLQHVWFSRDTNGPGKSRMTRSTDSTACVIFSYALCLYCDPGLLH